MRVIGLTGGIGAGKSEAASALEKLGARVIDADREGHEAYAHGSMGWRRITELFGAGVLTDGGEVDRARLGQLVFSNPQALAWLNAAVHPLIRDRLADWLDEKRLLGTKVAVIDAAVLYQAGWDDLTDEVWVVTATVDEVVARLTGSRVLHASEVHRRLGAQEEMVREAVSRADVVIENNGTLPELHETVERFWNERILTTR